MSGGHFNYSQWLFDEIAQTIAADIARAPEPKSAKIHENYWTIEVMECPGSYYTMGHSGWMEFSSYEEAKEYLLFVIFLGLAHLQRIKKGNIVKSTLQHLGIIDDL